MTTIARVLGVSRAGRSRFTAVPASIGWTARSGVVTTTRAPLPSSNARIRGRQMSGQRLIVV